MKKVIVLSLGGSLIVPEKMDPKFLHNFKKTLRAYYKDYHFVVVCGGGTVARKYITVLEKEGRSYKDISLAGIRATRLNAEFMMELFGKEANDKLPKNMKQIKANFNRNNVVICGALRYAKKSTTDGVAAKIAAYLKCPFVNLTDVKGLYTKNPFKHKDAKFVPYENWKDFEARALKLKAKNGQHFVLDQKAAVLIRKYQVPTYIIGKDLSNLKKILEGKKFIGTFIGK